MRKITLLLSFIACVILVNAQNLLVNPGFETWSGGIPTGWIFDKTTATISQESTIIETGSSLKVFATGTYWVTQNVAIVPEKTYTLSFSYYIGGGDGTDFRIWSNFYNQSGSTQSFSPMTLTDSLALKGPGGNSSSAYFPNETGAWKSYTYDVIAPAGYQLFLSGKNLHWINGLSRQFLFWRETTGLTRPSADHLDISIAGKMLTVTNSAVSSVEIFNMLGVKVKAIELVNGSAALNLSKGIYIVRAGNKTAKIRM